MSAAAKLPKGRVDMSFSIDEPKTPVDIVYFHSGGHNFLTNHSVGVRSIVLRGEAEPVAEVSVMLVERLTCRAVVLDFDLEQARSFAQRMLAAVDDAEAALVVVKQGGAA